MARFDYIGFGPKISKDRLLRKTLSEGIDFPESQIVLSSKGPIGCSSLPSNFYFSESCLKFSSRRVPENSPSMNFSFSHLGGMGINLQAQWLQAQWRQHTGAKVSIRSVEQKTFLRQLRKRPPALYRKGVGLDYPSCRSAMEIFAVGHPKNYGNLDIPGLNQWLERYDQSFEVDEKRKLCSEGLKILLQGYWYIPLGKMHFSLLANGEFEGWELNSLNQLDLTHLKRTAQSP